jgi:hypothetical protein
VVGLHSTVHTSTANWSLKDASDFCCVGVQRPSRHCRPGRRRAPQPVLPITFSRSTGRARRSIRSATSSGCSTILVAWLIKPGSRDLPSGSVTVSQRPHSCSWRGSANSSE